MGRGCWHPSLVLWDEGSRHSTPSAFNALFQRPMLTLWSPSVWPVSPPVWPGSLSVWPVLVGPVPAMMGDVKLSVGLRAGCRLTLPTCTEHSGGHGAVAMTPARTNPTDDTDLLAVPCPPALGIGGWQRPCAVRE